MRLDNGQAPAIVERIGGLERPFTIGDMLREPDDRQRALEALALLVLRGGRETLLPNDDFALAAGDEILFAGRARARRRMSVTMSNRRVLYYVCTGREPPRRWKWERSAARDAAPGGEAGGRRAERFRR